MNDKIDVVIPWVDDNDELWLKKKKSYSSQSSSIGELTSINRYHDYGTLKYVLRSIANNMNWVDNVILVTDNQLPEWLNTREVRVVDHKEFINGKLPTFNSNVIMTNLDKIPQLNEQFIAFNDETIVWNAVKKTDFFKNNLPVDSLIETGTVPKNDGFYHISLNGVALINERFSKRNVMLKNINKFFSFKYGIQIFRTLLSLPYGGFIGFLNQHLIIPYKKNDFKDACSLFPMEFERTWDHRFRELDDINDWLVRYIRNLKGNFTPGYLKGQFFSLSDFEKTMPKISQHSKVIVINDDSHYNIVILKRIQKLLSTKFPEKSKYEK